MKILINHTTTDKDLSLGTKVCYKDQEGYYSKVGTIDMISANEGLKTYSIDTAIGNYKASEVKLIREYTYKKEVLNDYLKGLLEVPELIQISQDTFNTEVATIDELERILNNNFLLSIASENADISKDELKDKINAILARI